MYNYISISRNLGYNIEQDFVTGEITGNVDGTPIQIESVELDWVLIEDIYYEIELDNNMCLYKCTPNPLRCLSE